MKNPSLFVGVSSLNLQRWLNKSADAVFVPCRWWLLHFNEFQNYTTLAHEYDTRRDKENSVVRKTMNSFVNCFKRPSFPNKSHQKKIINSFNLFICMRQIYLYTFINDLRSIFSIVKHFSKTETGQGRLFEELIA